MAATHNFPVIIIAVNGTTCGDTNTSTTKSSKSNQICKKWQKKSAWF